MNKYILILSFFFFQTVAATSFPGSGFGDIPDGPGDCDELGEPLAIYFPVENITELYKIELEMNIKHNHIGDIIAELEAPDSTRHVLFGKTGAFENECAGYLSNLEGTYRFTDEGVNNWWTVAANLGNFEALPDDTPYKTTSIGGVADAGLPTSMNQAFSNVINPNGTWTLYIYDSWNGNDGHVADASLIINGVAGQISDGTASYDIADGGYGNALVTDIDYLSGLAWFYRTGDDSQEYIFPIPDYATYSSEGDSVTITWLDVDDKGFRADLTHVIDQTGLNIDEAILTNTMKITNIDINNKDISLFNYADLNIVQDNDSAQLNNGDFGYIRQTNGNKQLEYRAGSNDNYHIGKYDLVLAFYDNDIDDLPNEGGDGYGPDDVGTAFQWFSGPLEGGSSYQVQTTVAVGNITAPEPADPVILSDLIFADNFDPQ